MNNLISVILTTYNWPNALELVLQSLQKQTEQNFEVIIADDGSTISTKNLVEELKLKLSFPLQHVWQEDIGFRAAKIRNQAAAAANGDYLIFLDGDCVTPRYFMSTHRRLAERGWFVAGNRILLSEEFTQTVVDQSLQICDWSFKEWWQAFTKSQCNRFLPLISLPDNVWRKMQKLNWRGVKTCNLGVWREDFLAVNGFDEEFSGWGYEDSDLIIRTIRNGIRHKSGRFAVPVFHLWHREQDRAKAQLNFEKLTLSRAGQIKAPMGVDQYLQKNV